VVRFGSLTALDNVSLVAAPVNGLTLTSNRNRWDSLAEALGVSKITVLTTDEDMRAAEREQMGRRNQTTCPIERDPA
jgi:hypothetical protein